MKTTPHERLFGVATLFCLPFWACAPAAAPDPGHGEEDAISGYFSPQEQSFGFYPGTSGDVVSAIELSVDADDLFVSDGAFTQNFYEPSGLTRTIASGEILELLRKTDRGTFAHVGWLDIVDAEFIPLEPISAPGVPEESDYGCVRGNFNSYCTIWSSVANAYYRYSLYKSGDKYQRHYIRTTSQWGSPCPASCNF